jgi:metal-responsive CopG/Arc/MetJ family transcriptional regulator
MSTKVTLPDDLADELARVAAERGVSVDQVVAELVATQLSAARSERPARRRLAFAGIGASTSRRGAADADEMLAEGFGRD